MSQELVIAILGGLGAAFGWGLSEFFAKKAVDKVGETTLMFWGMMFGIIPALGYFLMNLEAVSLTAYSLAALVLFGVFYTAAYLFHFRALEKGQVSIISPLTASYAAFTVLVSSLLFKEIITPFRWISLGLVFLGVIAISIDLSSLKKLSFKKKDLAKGIPQSLMAVAIFAFWYPLWDSFIESRNWIGLLVGLRLVQILTVYVLAKIQKVSLRVKEPQAWGLLAAMGLLDGIGYVSFTWGFSATKMTSVVAMLSAIFPLPAIILARMFLKDKISKIQLIGVLIILGGLVMIAGS